MQSKRRLLSLLNQCPGELYITTMIKKGLVSTVFLLCCFVATAQQLRIVRDNVLCNYGLKDDAGKWIVEPKYTEITPLQNKGFRTYDGVVYGLLDPLGKELTEPSYDELNYRHDCDCYFVRQNGKRGVLSENGEVRIVTDYTFVTYFKTIKQFLLHQQVGDSTVSYLTDHLGNRVSGPISGAILPRPFDIIKPEETEQPYSRWIVARSYTCTEREDYCWETKPLGITDSEGKILLPMIYDKIHARKYDSYWVVESGKLGIVHLNGKTIVEPVYYPESLPNNPSSVLFPQENKPAIVRNESGQFGLMNENGKLILPVVYASIQRTQDPDLLAKKVFFLIRQSGKWGYANEKGELVIPVNYDTLVPFKYRHKLVSGGSEQKMYGFIAKNNDEYGVIDLNGDTLVDIQYCDWMCLRVKGEIHVLSRDNRNYSVSVDMGQVKLQPFEEVGGDERYRFFRINDHVLPLEWKGNTWQLAAYREMERPIHLFQLVRSVNYNVWYDEEGKAFGDYTYLSHIDDRLLMVQTKSGKRGIMRFPERTFVMDTAYRSLNFDSYGTFWAEKYGEDETHCWQAYNREGKQLSETCFSNYFTIGDTTVVSSNGKCGVVKSDLTWLIPPTYRLMVKFGSSSWLVRGVNGGIGAIDVNGKRIADTIYTGIEPVYKKYDQDTTASVFPDGEWWLLKRNSDSLLISSRGATISTLKQRKTVLHYLDEGIIQQQSLQGALLIGFYDEAIRTTVLRSGYKQRLIGEYRKWNPNSNRCNAFSRADSEINKSEHCSNSDDQFVVVSAGKRFYTYAIVRCFTHYSMEEPGDRECMSDYSNYVLSDGRWKEVTLLNVFGKGGTVLKNELQRAIQLRKDEQLPCYDPGQLVQSVRGFYLSSEGVHLNVSIGDYGLTLLIPKSRLSALSSAKWLVPSLN